MHHRLYLYSPNPAGRMNHFRVITEQELWPREGKQLALRHTVKWKHSQNGKVSDSNAVRTHSTTFCQVDPWHRPNPLGTCFLRSEEGPGERNWYLSKAYSMLSNGSQIFSFNPPNIPIKVFLIILITHLGETEAQRGWIVLGHNYFCYHTDGKQRRSKIWTRSPGSWSAHWLFIMVSEKRRGPAGKTDWSPKPTPPRILPYIRSLHLPE